MTFVFLYTNKTTQELEFDNWKDAAWYAHNEGDHIIDWYEKERKPIKMGRKSRSDTVA